MLEMFLVMVIGFPLFYAQLIPEKEKNEWLTDIALTLGVIALLIIFSW